MRSAVFFERDGTLNFTAQNPRGQNTPLFLSDFRINAPAEIPLRKLKASGFILLATTNQPGLSRGYQLRRELDLMNAAMQEQLDLDDILVCPHDESDDCPCRKPKAGLLIEAGFKWHLDLERCFVVSDKWQDAQAAHIAGCTSILIQSPRNGSGHHDFVVPDIATAAAKILSLHSRAYSVAV